MPNWKKIIVSGSDASLNSLKVTLNVTASSFTGSFTGSLLGTSSYASTALTASNALTASFVNPLRQIVQITGSLITTGSNTLIGNTSLTGSFNISGSEEITGYVKFMPVSTNIDNSVSASYIYVSGSTNDLYFSQNGKGFSNTTRLRWLEGNLYTGLLNGGLITATTGSTVFNIASGSGIVVTLNASLNDNPYPTIKYVSWPAFTSQSLTYRTTDIQTFVGIDSNGAIIQQNSPWNDGQYNTSISLGTVLHQNKSTINASITYPNVAYGYKQRTYDFIKAFGPLKLSGLNIITSGSLGLNVGSGTAWADGRNYQNDPSNPSYITDTGTSVSKIFRYYQSGSSFVQDTNGGLGYTSIDPANYNNNGTLTAVPGNGSNRQYSVQRVFWYPNSATKGIVVYYGNATYPTLTDAVANIPYETFFEVENTKQNAVYLGAIAIRNDGVFTDSTSYTISTGGIFRQVGGSGGGGTAPAARLVDLADVSTTGTTNGQVLTYDATALKWKNSSYISASISGNALTATSASYAQTASYANNFTVAGTLTAQTIVVQTITSSVVEVTGSTQFGSTTSNTHDFTGSVAVSGSLLLNGSAVIRSNQTSSMSVATASYVLNAVSSSFATLAQTANTASYILNAVSSSRAVSASRADSATTASYALNSDLLDGFHASVFATTGSNSFNGNQVITGSLTVGSVFPSATISENTLTLGPPPAGGAGEGGQLLLQASGGLYTSASMWDNWQNQTRLLRGTNAGSDAVVASFNMGTKQVQFPAYNSSTAFSGTATANLSVDSNGNIITTAIGSSLTGGTANYLARWSSSTTLTTGSIYDSGTNVSIGNTSASYKLDVTGDIRATGAVIANANGAMYFRGGDDAELWDINIANTVGLYGQQNPTVGSIKLGNNGGTISGYSSSIGIGTTTPNNTLQVVGGVTATSFTGSLLGTASYASQALTASYALTAPYSGLQGTVPTWNQNTTGTAATASYVVTAQTASYVVTAQTASYVLNAVNSSNAATASSADNFTVRGTLTAQTLVVQTITSSVAEITGSSQFGSTTSNTHDFTGSVAVSGSLLLNGSSVIRSNQTSSMSVATASYVLNAVSSSYALTSTTAASATIVNGTSGQLVYKDDRIIEPNSITSARAQFGFTSWNNNNASPYADYLHLRSYTDATGGNDNLVSFLKNGIGMRIWQQSWNSASAYSDYRDVALLSGSAAGYIPLYQTSNVLTGSLIYQSGLNIGINKITPNTTLDVNGNVTITGSLNVTGGITGSLLGTATTASYALTAVSSSYATTALTASYWSGSVPIATSASYALTASYVEGMPSGSSYAALVQSGSSATWTFNHNLGYLYPVVTVYDANNNQIIPSQVSASSINQLVISFSSARTGYATAVIGSATPTPATVNAYTSVGATAVTSVITGSYNGAFWNYTAVSASNARAGQIMSVWSGSAITFSETTTNDIGNTSGLTFTASLSGNTTVLTAGSTTANWNIKLISTYL